MNNTPLKVELEFENRIAQIIRDAATAKGMSPRAVVRHWMALGQLVDVHMDKGDVVRMQSADGTIYDPLQSSLKKSGDFGMST